MTDDSFETRPVSLTKQLPVGNRAGREMFLNLFRLLQRLVEEATENKEYNDKIKSMRESAQQQLRMMMW